VIVTHQNATKVQPVVLCRMPVNSMSAAVCGLGKVKLVVFITP
jgi:hypothetical protein